MAITRREAAIVSAYTGFSACNFGLTQKVAEELLGRPIWTHEFASEDLAEQLREAAKPEFLAMCAAVAELPPEKWEDPITHSADAYNEGLQQMLGHLPANKPVAIVQLPEQ